MTQRTPPTDSLDQTLAELAAATGLTFPVEAPAQ